jgi:hypothetical protein
MVFQQPVRDGLQIVASIVQRFGLSLLCRITREIVGMTGLEKRFLRAPHIPDGSAILQTEDREACEVLLIGHARRNAVLIILKSETAFHAGMQRKSGESPERTFDPFYQQVCSGGS